MGSQSAVGFGSLLNTKEISMHIEALPRRRSYECGMIPFSVGV